MRETPYCTIRSRRNEWIPPTEERALAQLLRIRRLYNVRTVLINGVRRDIDTMIANNHVPVTLA